MIQSASVCSSARVVFLVVVLGSVTSAGQQREGLAEEASRYRMTEAAFETLVGIAELQTGVTVLRYRKENEDAQYHPVYESTVCPVPGATRLQALFAAGRADIEPELLRLRTVADSDNSGFVSNAEASLLFLLVEFGLRLNYLAEKEGNSVARLAPAMGMRAEDLRTRVREYSDFVDAARQQAVVFVAAPILDSSRR